MFNLKVLTIALMACLLQAVQAVELDSWYTGYHHGSVKPVHTAGAISRYHYFDQGYYSEDDNKDCEDGKHYDAIVKDKHIVAEDHFHDIDVGTKTYFIKIVKNAKDVKHVKDVKDKKDVKDVKDAKSVKEAKVGTDVKNTENVKDVKTAKDLHDAIDVTTVKDVPVSSTVKSQVEQKPSIDIRSVKTIASDESVDYNVMKNHKDLDYNTAHHHLTAHKVIHSKLEGGKDEKVGLNVVKTVPTLNYALNGNKVEDGIYGIGGHHDFDHNTANKDVKKYTDVYPAFIDHYSTTHKENYGEYHPISEAYHHGYKNPYENVKSSHKISLGKKHHYNHDKYDVKPNDNHGVKSTPYWNYGKLDHAIDTDYYGHQNVELNGDKFYKTAVKKSYNYKY